MADEGGAGAGARACSWGSAPGRPCTRRSSVARELGAGKNVVTVLPDTGERYFSLEEYFRERERAACVLVVGVGGLGCPAALALAHARGTPAESPSACATTTRSTPPNLHRQILYGEADVGVPKVAAAARALRGIDPGLELRLHDGRLLPGDAVRLVRDYDVVLEGADNFATKFLAADACALAGVPVVHASAVRWVGTALAVGARGRPCYRCLFEDVLDDSQAPSCAEAGVMGPVVGVVAAAQVDLALAMLGGREVAGQLFTFDGRTEATRRHTVRPRGDCPLCGGAPRIRSIDARDVCFPRALRDLSARKEPHGDHRPHPHSAANPHRRGRRSDRLRRHGRRRHRGSRSASTPESASACSTTRACGAS